MTVCRIIEAGVTPEQYDQVREQLGLGDTPPPGSSFHVAGRDDDGKIRIVELWESREQAEAFGERVGAAREAAGVGGDMPTITYLEVHNLVQG
jgi:hypothetical protein